MTPVRVAVEMVYFTGRKGGAESYLRELVGVLAAEEDLDLVGIGNSDLPDEVRDWFPGRIADLPVSGENRMAWAAAVGFAVGPRARVLRADVLHCPSNFAPMLRSLPTVVTVHDVLPLAHPEWVPGGRGRAVAHLLRRGIACADHVITDSAATARDLRTLLSTRQEKIDVVPLGAAPGRDDGTSARVAGGRPAVLAGGNRMPHKNLERLIEAWVLIPAAERPLLVVTGSHGADPLRPVVERLGLTADVDLRSWVDRAELGALYRDAAAFVFPTRFEGFGLPVLEAMASGCPVIASDIPVLREVGAGAAVYVDTCDPAALAQAVRRVVGDPALRERLRTAGRARVAELTWEQTGAATAQVYRRVAAAGRART